MQICILTNGYYRENTKQQCTFSEHNVADYMHTDQCSSPAHHHDQAERHASAENYKGCNKTLNK